MATPSLFDLYPAGWPACVFCGEPVLDGHLTCGRVECNESAARDLRWCDAPEDEPEWMAREESR